MQCHKNQWTWRWKREIANISYTILLRHFWPSIAISQSFCQYIISFLHQQHLIEEPQFNKCTNILDSASITQLESGFWRVIDDMKNALSTWPFQSHLSRVTPHEIATKAPGYLLLTWVNLVVVVVTLFPTKIHENTHMYNTLTVVSPQNVRMYFLSGCQKKLRLIELAAATCYLQFCRATARTGPEMTHWHPGGRFKESFSSNGFHNIYSIILNLAHWSRVKMAAISQTTLSNAFIEWKW